jgi:predicted dehydrogenase
VDAYRLELEAFAAAARGGAEPAPTLAESVVTAFTLDALLESGRDGRAVAVDVPEAVLA